MKKAFHLSAISVGILASSLLLTSTAFAHNYKGEGNYKGEAVAAPCPVMEKLQSGFYVGGQVGYDSYRVRQNETTATGIAGVGTVTLSRLVNPTGFVGGLFAGYGQYFNDYYYLGGELLGNYSNAQSSTSTSSSAAGTLYSQTMNVYGSWGLSLLPGLKVNDTSLLYARLGYRWDRMKVNEFDPALSAGNVNTTKWSNGFNLGLGIETLITCDWSVRTEYNHTWNNSFHTTLTGANIQPAYNQVMLGLVYHIV